VALRRRHLDGICSKAATGPRFNSVFGQIDAQVWNGHSYYNALLFSLRRRLASGLEVQGSFTWSRTIDTSSSVGSGGPFSNSISGQFLFAPLRALSDFNVSRSFVLSGRGRSPSAAPIRWAAGNWALSFWSATDSRLPRAISGDALGQANQSNFDVPNRLNNPGCGRPVNPGNPLQYINLGCFAFANPSTLFGNAGRNELIGPGVVNADVSLFKNIPFNVMREGARLQIMSGGVQSAQPCQLRSTADQQQTLRHQGESVNFAGQITSLQTPGRVIQLGLKLLW